MVWSIVGSFQGLTPRLTRSAKIMVRGGEHYRVFEGTPEGLMEFLLGSFFLFLVSMTSNLFDLMYAK